jgi:WD40 repeat protein
MLAAAAGDEVVLWDTEKARLLDHLPTGTEVLAVALSSDGRWLAWSGDDGAVRLWDVAARRELGEPLPARTDVAALVFTGPSRLALAHSDGTLAEWDLKRWRIRTSFDRIQSGLLHAIAGTRTAP